MITHEPSEQTLYYWDEEPGPLPTLDQVEEAFMEWLEEEGMSRVEITQLAYNGGCEFYLTYEPPAPDGDDWWRQPSDPNPAFHNSNFYDITTGSR